jgi:hypothetical protein
MNRSRYVATIGVDGALAIDGEERFYGVHAASIRQEYQEPRTQRRQLEGTLSMVAPGAEITSLDVSDLTRLEEGPSYRYGARLPRYATPLSAPGAAAGADDPRAPARLVVPLTLFPHRVTSSYGTLERRETDLVLPYAWSTRNVIRYAVPPGYRAEELPAGQTIDTPYASLDQTIRAVDGGYEVDDTVTIKQRRVPKADYPRFREALLAIDRALERKVVLSR